MTIHLRLWVALLGCSSLAGCFAEPPSSSSTGVDASSTGGAAETTNPSSTGPDESTSDPDPSSTGLGTAAGSSSSSDGGGMNESSTGPDDTDTDKPMPACGPDWPFLFLMFDGIELTGSGIGIDNAPEGIVGDAALIGIHGPYTEPDREAVLDLVRGHFAPAGICVTDTRPPTPDFDMIVVTSDTLGAPNSLGFVNLDCGDAELNNVNVVFLSDQVNLGVAVRAIAISKFAGSLYGLEEVDANQDIMNRFVGMTSNGATFTEECVPLAEGAVCQPDAACPQGQQSALTRLTL